jgi:hypothetical protein
MLIALLQAMHHTANGHARQVQARVDGVLAQRERERSVG